MIIQLLMFKQKFYFSDISIIIKKAKLKAFGFKINFKSSVYYAQM